MATIAEQLTQLTQDRDDLVSNLTTKGISGLTGDETFTELVPEVLNIQGGADLSEYFKTSLGTGSNSNYSGLDNCIKELPDNYFIPSGSSLEFAFYNTLGLTKAPMFSLSGVTSIKRMFMGCSSLLSIPQYDTSNVTNFEGLFLNCSSLTTLPVLNLSSATNLQYMFYGCTALSDDSINNILASLTGATSYSGTKTLAYLGFSSFIATAQEIEALSNYQDFVNAGWTIGF